MTAAAGLRKLALTAHVVSSVGWLGAVGCFVALSITGLASQDAQTTRAAYLAMEATGWFVLVPLSVASLLTGLLQSLVTKWGLIQHYWVLAKLVINVVATAVLLLYMRTLDDLAGVAASVPSASRDLSELRDPSPLVHAGGALVLLVAATSLAVYKPRGMTRYGQRKQRRRKATTRT